MTTERVKQILSWYGSDNPGVKTNLARMMNTGTLAGTGKMVILPVDQGFEHGPARSFGPNPAAYDPDYHFQLALDSGCNAYAAPLGFLEAGADKFAGQIPLILKLNNSDTMAKVPGPISAVTGSVKDALRLGCSAIGYSIYPGSEMRNRMYEDLRELILEAKSNGLPTVLWAYPRGSLIAKDAEQAPLPTFKPLNDAQFARGICPGGAQAERDVATGRTSCGPKGPVRVVRPNGALFLQQANGERWFFDKDRRIERFESLCWESLRA